MSSPAHAPPPAEPRDRILDAAQERLIHYGYHKTTMAEIAEDVGMSAANLYRYFANKEEIAAECASRCMNERFERLRRHLADPRKSAAEKLMAYARELVDDSHALAGEASKIGELVATIMRQRHALVHEKLAVHYQLIGDILNQGVSSGEFRIEDIETVARHVYSTLSFFDVPLFVGLFDRAEFDRRLGDAASAFADRRNRFRLDAKASQRHTAGRPSRRRRLVERRQRPNQRPDSRR